jgi:hypothetical protein
VKGRWAAGIVPRNFCWIVKDKLAVSERPGGYAPYHRRVRRHEEILWLRGHGFTRVVSLLPSQHNLHAYEELGLAHSHFPIPTQADPREALSELYGALLGWLRSGELILVHQEELGDRLAGVMAGFLCWSGVLPEPPRAISAVEQLLRRQMGSVGRSLAIVAVELPPPLLSGPHPLVVNEPAAVSGASEVVTEAGPEPLAVANETPPARPARRRAPRAPA